MRTCAARISGRSRCAVRDGARAAVAPRAVDRRPLRPGRRGPLPRVRRHARAQRRARRADHARRLRRLLAGHAARHRSVRLPRARDPGRVAAGRRALLESVRLRRARARGNAREELAADRLRPGAGAAYGARGGGGGARHRRVLRQPVDRTGVDAQGADRRGAGRTRVYGRHVRRWPRARRRRGGERRHVRRALPRDRRAGDLRHRPRGAPAGAVRPMTGAGTERRWGIAILAALGLLALLPLARPREDVLNFAFLVLLSITLAESWNHLAGYAGQVHLGSAAFIGSGTLHTCTLRLCLYPV